MAFTVTPIGAKRPYTYQRHPLVMHTGAWPNIKSKTVASQTEEDAAVADGWSTDLPPAPEPGAAVVAVSLEERVAAIEERLAVAEAKLAAPPSVTEAPLLAESAPAPRRGNPNWQRKPQTEGE